jgi:hypothetical protein
MIAAPAATPMTRGRDRRPCPAIAAARIRLASPGTRALADSAATKAEEQGVTDARRHVDQRGKHSLRLH